MRRGLIFVGLVGLMLIGASAAQAGSLHGTIALSVLGGRVHGYSAGLAAVVGTSHGQDSLTFGLSKRTGNLTQSHEWSIPLPARDITIDRARASIKVIDLLGRGGSSGELDFTFAGHPQRKTLPCPGAKDNVVMGTLRGTIRIKTGESFFGTVTVSRMSGIASDTPFPPAIHCPLPRCPSAGYAFDGMGPPSPTPVLGLDASTPAVRNQQLRRVTVGVSESTTGTPFSEIRHKMTATGTKVLLASNPNLTSATISTPGGLLSGGVSLQSSGALSKSTYACKGGHSEVLSRPVMLTTGAITAAFDSIGNLSVDTNLNNGLLFLQLTRTVPNKPRTAPRTPGTLHLSQFLSPDSKVWCTVGTAMDVHGRSCGTYPEPPTRAAELDGDGNVRLCSVPRLIYPPGGHVPEGCFQNWNADAPILKYGQRTEQNGLRCTSATNGITCIKVAGTGKGKGFRINKDEVVEIGQAPAAASPPANPPEFRARLAGGTLGCSLGNEGTFCQGVPIVSEGSDPLVQVARLQPSGELTSCTEYEAAPQMACYEGNMGDPIPDLSPGETSTVGPFTCKVLETGVECTVTVTGKGFLITPDSVTEVGG